MSGERRLVLRNHETKTSPQQTASDLASAPVFCLHLLMTSERAELNQQLLEIFGAPLLDYALNGVAVPEVSEDDTPRQYGISQLSQICAEIRSDDDPVNQREHVHRQLVRTADAGRPLATALRLQCGGTVPEPVSEDPFVDALYELAVLALPLEMLPLLPRDPSWVPGRSTNFVGIRLNRTYQRCYITLLEDPELSTLFPAPEGGRRWDPHDPLNARLVTTNLLWSTGDGGTTTVGAVPASLLAFVFTRMRLARELTVSALPDHVEHAVHTVRRLARRKRSSVPLVVPLDNIELEPDVQEIPLGSGRILPAAEFADRVPGVSPDDPAVLVLESDLRLLDALPPQSSEEDVENDFGRRVKHREGTITVARRKIEERITAGRLAITLPSKEGAAIAPTVAYRQVVNPLRGDGGGARGWSRGSSSSMPMCTVDAATAAEMSQLAAAAFDLPSSMAMGARRIVSAVGERIDPLDAFVDAIIAWENLLGSETEVTFRLCAAIAKLLEVDDSDARLALFKELKDLYGVRSGLVHGDREPKPSDATNMRDRAVHVALTMLRAIAGSDELCEARSAGERNRLVLLGA
jgi:hypothetical protein